MTIKVTHSYDGVEIPAEGVDFTVNIFRDNEEVTESITLHDVLAGLRLKVAEGKSQSQAQTFASFALQKGFTSEEEILDHFRAARPYIRDGQIECRSWSLISLWEKEVKAERQRKARDTMRREGTEITPGQMQFAFNLVPQLRENGFDRIAQDLLDLLQVNEEKEGPKGAEMSAALSKAKGLLDMAAPSQGTPASEGTTRSGRPVAQSSGEDPF